MNRAQYHAARRAAYLAQREVRGQLRAAEYADSPAWAQRQIERRCLEIVKAVPSPFVWREHHFETRMRNRRARVLELIRERGYAPEMFRETFTYQLQNTLSCWRHAAPVELAPLPADFQPIELRRAA